ncbi:SDR family NAD(P)-dependent oxidoreductase [Beijerinckia sp. L45]|uniref:SDR family NAD(P)-dependent oxidoreductase n=1 Tax=Beijerinckia sp. L45 TaxID=1641855 RepID=UPI00131E78F9|nr:SDR family oxidoreductase [Beijerinckia sp. L45]
MTVYSSLKDRVVIVTGGARGFGRIMAMALLEQGVRLMLTGARSQENLDETVASADALYPGRCLGMLADVSDFAACKAVAEAVEGKFGRIDVLINNAGRPSSEAAPVPGERYAFWNADVDGYRRIVDTNFVGPFLMAKAVAPGMVARGFGKIINISTSRPTMIGKGANPYGACKAGLEASSVVWAKDLDGTGVTVNVLLPGGPSDTGLIWGSSIGTRATPNFKAGKGALGQEGLVEGGLLPPEIMAAPALWLCADDSNAINGRRIAARDWDSDLPPAQAAERALQAPHSPPSVM